MKTTKALITVGLVLASLAMLSVVWADDFDQASKLTFSQPIQIPGRVLPAGTYWFVLANSSTNRNLVHVFSSDYSVLYSTLLTISTEHAQAFDHTAITFAERGSMQPVTVVSWFYPGESNGHEFLYSKPENQELARVKQQTIMALARNAQPPATRDAQQIVVFGD